MLAPPDQIVAPASVVLDPARARQPNPAVHPTGPVWEAAGTKRLRAMGTGRCWPTSLMTGTAPQLH
jgi:hypothetical protein